MAKKQNKPKLDRRVHRKKSKLIGWGIDPEKFAAARKSDGSSKAQ